MLENQGEATDSAGLHASCGPVVLCAVIFVPAEFWLLSALQITELGYLCCTCGCAANVMLAALLSLMLSLLVSCSDFCSSLFFFLPLPPSPPQGCPVLHCVLPTVCKPEQAGPERPQCQGSVLCIIPLRMCGWQYSCGGCQSLRW